MSRFGCPLPIVNDGGPENQAPTKGLLERFNVWILQAAAYHPQSNGLVERGHQNMVDALAKLTAPSANSRVCSGSVQPGLACPCTGSHLKIRTSTEKRWARSNPCLNTFYFCCFLIKGGLHAVSWYVFCNALWYRCGGGLQVTWLATRRLGRSCEQGIWVVVPGKLTTGVEYKERGGMWQSEIAGMLGCMGGCSGMASERR